MDPNTAPATSRFTVQLVISFIGASLMTCLVGTIILAATHIDPPGLLADVGKMALGGIIGVLATTRVGNPIPAKEVAVLPPVVPPAVTTTTTTEVHAPDSTVTVDGEQLDPDA